MNNKNAVVATLLLNSVLSLFSWVYGETKATIYRDTFFDATPPSYLLPLEQVEEVTVQENEKPFIADRPSFEDDNRINLEPISQTYSHEEGLLEELSLQEVAQRIVFYHPRVVQAIGHEKSEEEMINVAKSAYYPEVRGGLGLKYDRNDSSGNDKEYVPNADIEISQNIYDFGRTANSIKSAEYGHLGAKAMTSATNEELIHTATSEVIAIIRDRQLIKLAKEQVMQVKSLKDLVEERYKKGASNLSDVLQAHSRVDDVESLELDIEAQYESALRNLGIMIGLPNISSVVMGKLPSSLEQSCSLLSEWEEIPEYAIADLEAKRAEAELKFSQANEMPTISLQGNISRPLNDSSRRGVRNDTRVSLNISVPFYEGGRLEANKRAASSRKLSAEARKEEVRLSVNQALSQLQVRLQNMQKRQSLLVRRVDNLRGTKELYKKQYLDLGTRSLIDLLNSEQEFHQAQVDVEVNKAGIIQVQIDCAFYQGKLRDTFKVSR